MGEVHKKIRRDINDMLKRMSAGENAGERGFNNSVWEDIKHKHVSAKLVVFVRYSDDDTIRLCALKKHDSYRARNERNNIEKITANNIVRSAMARSQRSPEWSEIKWSDPRELHGHPEIRELSREGLERLYREVLDEQDGFAMLSRQVKGMTEHNASRVADAWLNDLLIAQQEIEGAILEQARKKLDYSSINEFSKGWDEPSSP